MTTSLVRPFAIISGAQVHRARDGREKQPVELVEATHRLHAAGETVNPASYFLRFPDRPASRIITRPASLGGTFQVDGLKWTSSFLGNGALRTPRASAVLIVGNFKPCRWSGATSRLTRNGARGVTAAVIAPDLPERCLDTIYQGLPSETIRRRVEGCDSSAARRKE